MTYRSDLDALEARKDSLEKEVEEKRRERDAAAQLLGEARDRDAIEKLDSDVMSGRKTLRRVAIGAAIMFTAVTIMVIGAAYLRATVREDTAVGSLGPFPAPVLTCEQVEPEHQETENATSASYTAALAARGLARISLDQPRTDGFESQEALEKSFGQPITSWKPFTYTWKGRAHTAIAGDIYMTTYWHRETPEFVADASDGVWLVKRAPLIRMVKAFTVKSCSWGCWGSPGPGAEPREEFVRDVWLVPAGKTFRGEVEIPYDAPTLNITTADLGCSSPA